MKKRKGIIKQIFACILCMVMAVTLLPTTAYAANISDAHYELSEDEQGKVDITKLKSLFAVMNEGVFHLASNSHTHDKKTFSPGVGQGVMITSNCYLVHDETVTNTTGIVVSGSAVVNICLNGHTLNLNTTNIWVNAGATLNIYDCSGGGKIINGAGTSYFNVNGSTAKKGGAIYVRGSTLNIYGGTIEGNTAIWGGAIFIDGSDGPGAGTSTVNMYGGTIQGNVAESGGGGIEVENKDSHFNMYGGSIINNTVTNTNGSVHKGGGVHFAAGTMSVQGKVNISGNTVAGVGNNLYVRKDKTIDIGSLAENSRIGVSAYNSEYNKNYSTLSTTVVTNQYGSKISSNEVKYMFMDRTHDNKTFALVHNGTELQIKKHTHDWVYCSSDHPWENTDVKKNQIFAKCNHTTENCAFRTNILSLTLQTEDAYCTGSAYEGTSFADEEEKAWDYAGLTIPIKYEGIDGTDYPSSATPPTLEGNYKATITVSAKADANDTTDTNYTAETTFKLVRRAGPAAPTGLLATAATAGQSDGTILGLDPTKKYEYSIDNGANWTTVTYGSSSISSLPAGTVKVREPGTIITKVGAEASVVVKTKQEKPELKYVTESASDGQIGKIGIKNADNLVGLTNNIEYEYTTDISDTSYKNIIGNGGNYISVTQLGIYYVRLKGTDTLEASPWVPLTAENAIVSHGMVSNLSSTGAALTATMARTTNVTAAGFRYKKKGASAWTTTTVASPDSNTTFTSDLTGLVANTEYVYQAYVTSSNGTIYGNEMLFRTSSTTTAAGSIKINVTNEDFSDSKNIVANIEVGNTIIASRETVVNTGASNTGTVTFTNLADGTYNVVVRTKDGNYTETKLIVISNGSAAEISFSIPKGKLSTTVEIKNDTPNIAVGGLNDIITNEEKTAIASGSKSVEVELVAEKKAEAKIAADAAAIKKIATSSKKIDTFLDLSIFKTTSTLDGNSSVTSIEKQDIGSINTKVLEIAIPYPNITKTGLTMYKYHNGTARTLKSLSTKPNADFADGRFYLDTSAKYIYLYAKEFSTYAIGYNTETPTPTPHTGGGSSSGGGGTYYYPVTGITVTPEKVTLTKAGETVQLTANLSPSYATNKNVTWTSDNEAVATIDSTGKVTAVGSGTATITATTQSGGKTATVEITVNIPSEETGVTLPPVNTEAPSVPTESKEPGTTEPVVSPVVTTPVEPNDTPAPATPDVTPAPTSVTPVVSAGTEAPKDTTAPSISTAPAVSATPTVTATDTPQVTTAPKKVAANFGTLKAQSVKQTSTSVTLRWNKVSGADGYLVYGSRCNSKKEKFTKKLIKTIKGNSTLTWTQKKLEKATYYKYQIKAYKLVDGKKVVIAKSVDIHAVTKGGKHCVASALKIVKLAEKKVSKTAKNLKLTLANDKTAKIQATEIPAENGKTIHQHRDICYESSNRNVAIVTKTGEIKAVGKGTCKIWVYAQNGVYKTITVMVK